jgi:hypothetical protein
MDFMWIDEDRLATLYEGMRIMESLSHGKVWEMEIFLYGMTSDRGVISAAKESIIDLLEEYWDEDGETTLREEEIALNEVAIAIHLNSDTIYTLLGRHGLDVYQMDFAYLGKEGEGVRVTSFSTGAGSRTRLMFSGLKNIVLAEGDIHLREYLTQQKTGQPMTINKRVERGQSAVAPPIPTTPQAPPTGGTPPVQNIASVVEKFLDRRR